MRKWIALFSHTGSEIVSVSRALGKTPAKIITNQSPDSKNINKNIKKLAHASCSPGMRNVIYTKNSPDIADYRRLFDEDALVTLHGWMRIIPKCICEEYEIYNLHPGLITKYPELKGKDPQDKVFEVLDDPEDVGCVIHRVIGEVDSGEVVMERSARNVFPSSKLLTPYLHTMASDMWIDYLNTKLYYYG